MGNPPEEVDPGLCFTICVATPSISYFVVEAEFKSKFGTSA